MSHPGSISQGIHAHRGYTTPPETGRAGSSGQDPLAILGNLFLFFVTRIALVLVIDVPAALDA